MAADEPVRRADPQTSLAILLEEADVVAFERRCVFLVENREVETVETDESFLRSDPEIAVLGLDDRLDGVLRQSVFGRPCLVTKLVQAPVRVEGRRANAGKKKQDGGEGQFLSSRGRVSDAVST